MTLKNRFLALAVLSSFCFSLSALADDFEIPGEFSATAKLTSEYAFRGIVQSDEHAAVQASVDYGHDSGFYAGVWGSSVDFNDDSEATVEIDFYTGVAGEIGNISWDVGGIYYYYPGADSDLDYDFVELAVALGYDFEWFALSGAANYSPDYLRGSGQSLYYGGYATVPLPYDLSVNGHAGYQLIGDENDFGADDYMDYSLGVGYFVGGFDLALDYVGTSLDEPGDIADNGAERVIFSVSRSFP